MHTSKEARREREKKVQEEGGDSPYPGWDEVQRENAEEKPAIVLTVTDDRGEVVRRLSGPVKAGFHRVAWDLRYPPVEPWTDRAPRRRYVPPFQGDGDSRHLHGVDRQAGRR